MYRSEDVGQSLPAPPPFAPGCSLDYRAGRQAGQSFCLEGLVCSVSAYLSHAPHCEVFTGTNAKDMAVPTSSGVTLRGLLFLSELPNAHRRTGFTMPTHSLGASPFFLLFPPRVCKEEELEEHGCLFFSAAPPLLRARRWASCSSGTVTVCGGGLDSHGAVREKGPLGARSQLGGSQGPLRASGEPTGHPKSTGLCRGPVGTLGWWHCQLLQGLRERSHGRPLPLHSQTALSTRTDASPPPGPWTSPLGGG